MRPIFTAAEMRALDARAIRDLGIPGFHLMDAAGSGAAALIGRWLAPIRGRRIVVVCGKGNNGGDGFVVARRLRARGAVVTVFLTARRDEVQGDAAEALAGWRGRVEAIDAGPDPGALVRALERTEAVVDALLGTGLTGPAWGQAAAAIEAINEAGRRGIPVIALDLPSGLSSDHGALLGPTVKATRTVTFAGLKRSLLLHPAAAQAGPVDVVDIGVPEVEAARGVTTWRLEAADVRRYFPAREPDAHKGRFGHLLVVAGSLGKTGAAVLAARAALRSGVGLCTIATPASQQPIVAAQAPEYMTEALPETAAGSLALAGHKAEARQALDEATKAAPHLSPFQQATVHVALGRSARALDLLERAGEERDPWLVWLKVDPMLEPLRAHPRMRRLLARVFRRAGDAGPHG